MIRKAAFILAHEIGSRSFYSNYIRLGKNQWRPYEGLRRDQGKLLRYLIGFSYEQVPYYRALFKSLSLLPRDIRSPEDLERLPVLTKDIIKANWEKLIPANLPSQKYDSRATGGSTGTPLQYRISTYDQYLGAALLYRGWGYGGYDLGDPMIFLAGSSLDTGAKPFLEKKVHELTRNIRKLSSFEMADAEMRHYSDVLNSFQPHFMRGYPSSIYFFARWLKENDIAAPQLDGVFTTAEKLLPQMRKTIGEAFRCEVFDNYGLNDGGVSAYECSEHCGLHIDSERSVMEVVDQDHRQLVEGGGEILATSLHNFAMPFIRYATGDMANLTETECCCGRHTKMLGEVTGRTVDILVTPEGTSVHGWFFLMIFWKHGQGIKEYQVIQTATDQIVIKIVPDENFDEMRLEPIRQLIATKSSEWDVQFKVVESIDRTRSGKYKFIINELVV